MVLTIVLFLVGLVLLYFGAEWLVAGSSSGALRFGIPPLIVGLTVVSFGTSAPELLVSLLALFDGKDGVSIGNILGSNIANIALILLVIFVLHSVTYKSISSGFIILLQISDFNNSIYFFFLYFFISFQKKDFCLFEK